MQRGLARAYRDAVGRAWTAVVRVWRGVLGALLGDPRTGKPRLLLKQQQQDMDEGDAFAMRTVGVVRSVYKEKFATPRQGSLVPDGRGCICLDRKRVDVTWSMDGLDQFSHAWVVFVFHTNTNVADKPTPSGKVRPPQGAGVKVGVFATRSPHRPNPIGLTLVRVTGLDKSKGILYVCGLDLCDGTPVLDIKPYVEHVDFPGSGVARTPKWVVNPSFERVTVTFAPEAEQALQLLVDGGMCEWYKAGEAEHAKNALVQMISLDPRDLNRGRGAFLQPQEQQQQEQDGEPASSFVRRRDRVGATFAGLETYVRFDALKVVFRPTDSRSFHVHAIALHAAADQDSV